MKLGIVVYSATGNTYTVATKLKDKLISLGHEVEIERLLTINSDKKNPEFETLPTLKNYDALIFGSWVESLGVSFVMKKYLEQLPSLDNKKVVCFVTQLFPFQSIGAKQAIKKMKDICKTKEAEIVGEGIVQWMFEKRRNTQIENLVNYISEVL